MTKEGPIRSKGIETGWLKQASRVLSVLLDLMESALYALIRFKIVWNEKVCPRIAVAL